MRKCWLLLALCPLCLFAQIPDDYYAAAQGKKGEALREALNSCISAHEILNYEGLQDYYKKADFRPDSTLWEIYSTCEFTMAHLNQAQNDFCMGWNKEHSVPKSWFNGDSPMYSDMIHVIPTDARVNNLRGNEAYGETASRTDEVSMNKYALGHIGSSNFSGYTSIGKVYEPDDRYKGDIARIYFYMVTCYLKKDFTKDGNGAKMFRYSNGTNYLTDYSVALLMKWHRNDPVSTKEINRNDSVYAYQHNRNPFVDFPELAEYIWGNKTATTFDLASILTAYSKEYVPLDTEGSDRTDYDKFGVNWFVNGQKLRTDSVFKNHKPTLPAEPTSCSATSNVFMGWSNVSIAGTAQTAPAVLFAANEDAPAINADVNFHAVFAHQEQGQGQGSVTETAYFDTEHGYKSSQNTEIKSAQASKVTITFNKASASNFAKFFSELRCYAGSTITLSGATITKVEFVPGNNDKKNGLKPNVGSMDDTGLKWTGSAANIVFTVQGDRGYRGLSAIKVTYDDNTTVFTYSDYITQCGGSTETIMQVIEQPEARKILRNGQILIIRGEKTYNVQGQIVQ